MKAKEEKTQHHKNNIMKTRNCNFYKVEEKLIRQKEDKIFIQKKKKKQKKEFIKLKQKKSKKIKAQNVMI